MKIKYYLFLFCFIFTLGGLPVDAASPQVRLKDIAKVIESRDNQIFGYGLVVGLRGTGDSRNAAFTNKALVNVLKKMGLSGEEKDFRSRNVASVMVTANLPPYVKAGQRISVTVASLGDASSLSGGILLMTSLQGPDYKTYAVAQGPLIVGGISGKTNKLNYVKNQTTVGRVENGAIVEVEIPITREDQQNVTVVLHDNSYVTASRIVESLIENDFEGAKAIDATTIKIPLKSHTSLPYVDFVAKVEETLAIPDSSAKVIINSRTGTVVIGEMVRLFPVGITHGSVSIRIKNTSEQTFYQSPERAIRGLGMSDEIEVKESKPNVVLLDPNASLGSLVESLNLLGVSTKEMISILQALKEANALVAEIEVI